MEFIVTRMAAWYRIQRRLFHPLFVVRAFAAAVVSQQSHMFSHLESLVYKATISEASQILCRIKLNADESPCCRALSAQPLQNAWAGILMIGRLYSDPMRTIPMSCTVRKGVQEELLEASITAIVFTRFSIDRDR